MTEPNAARMYDHYLGGRNNFPVDREAAEHVLRVAPWIRTSALENRAFLRRAVRYLAQEASIRQFVDIGTGLPTQGSVHEVAHGIDPGIRVAYVDNDPLVLAQSRVLLAGTSNATIIRGDLRAPEAIITHPDLTALINWDEPVALLLLAVLHFVPGQEDAQGIVATFRDAMAAGSFVALSHNHHVGDEDIVHRLIEIYRETSAPVCYRSREEIAAFFDGFELVPPGLVPLPEWRPEPRPYPAGDVWGLGGVARKPGSTSRAKRSRSVRKAAGA